MTPLRVWSRREQERRGGVGLGVGSSASALGALPNWPKMHHQFLNLVSTMPRKVKREERENTDGHGFQFH